jgi:hypothetical protein
LVIFCTEESNYPADGPAVAGLFEAAAMLLGKPFFGVIVCHGTLPNDSGALLDIELTSSAINATFMSEAMVLAAGGEALENQPRVFWPHSSQWPAIVGGRATTHTTLRRPE